MSSFSITSINGKRCTAVPRAAASKASTTAAEQQNTIVASSVDPVTQPPAAAPATTQAPAETTQAEPTPANGGVAVSEPTSQAQVTSQATAGETSAPPPAVVTTSSLQPTLAQSAVVGTVASEAGVETSTSANQAIQAVPSSAPSAVVPPTTSLEPTSVSPSAVTGGLSSQTTSLDGSFPSSTALNIPPAIVQSEIDTPTSTTEILSGAPTSAAGLDSSLVVSIATPTSTLATDLSSSATTASDSHSSNHNHIGAIVGGLLGGVAFISLISFLLWRYRKKRNDRRDSFLTPLTTPYSSDKSSGQGRFYEIDERSLGPTAYISKLKSHVSYASRNLSDKISALRDTLKNRISNGSSPSVNLNRGNSQFLEPIAQHSRSTSAASNQAVRATAKERITEWWQTVRAGTMFNLGRNRPPPSPTDPFAAARQMREEKAAQAVAAPDFATFLDHQRSASQNSSLGFGSLGLDFSSGSKRLSNPFADAADGRQPTVPNFEKEMSREQMDGPQSLGQNPFADPAPKIAQPQAAARPRAPSGSMLGGVMALPTIKEQPSAASSRYPSTISLTSSNRSTYMTTYSDARSKKGRSDPFDLSPPDLSLLPPMPDMPIPEKSAARSNSKKSKSISLQNGSTLISADPPSPLPPMGPTSTLLDSLQEFKNNRQSLRRSQSQLNALQQLPQSTPNHQSQPSIDDDVAPITPLLPKAREVSTIGAGPKAARVSEAGTYSSKYSSWGDPGPDLGPAALRRMESGNSGDSGWADDVGSPGSQGSAGTVHSAGGKSVGKAL